MQKSKIAIKRIVCTSCEWGPIETKEEGGGGKECLKMKPKNHFNAHLFHVCMVHIVYMSNTV